MKLYSLLLIPLILIAFTIVGCDNDSNSNAQEPDSEFACPCYSKEDVINTLVQEGGSVDCAVETEAGATGFSLDPGGVFGALVSTACEADGTNCTCLIGDDLMENLNFLQASECLTNMVGAIAELDSEGLSLGQCTIAVTP